MQRSNVVMFTGRVRLPSLRGALQNSDVSPTGFSTSDEKQNSAFRSAEGRLGPVPLTIYLDQMKWIDLARAETGHPRGESHISALEVFKRAVDEGRARFPLSGAHYLETGKQHVRRRREQLSATMMRLAGVDRIAPPQVIVPWEVRRSLIEVFELPLSLPQLQLFGQGAAHALDMPSARYEPPAAFDGILLSDEQRNFLADALSAKFEGMILGGLPPVDYPDNTRVVLPAIENLDNKFVVEQNRVAGWVQTLGRGKLEDVMAATAMADIMEPLIGAALELNLPLDEVVVPKNVLLLLEHMPSRWVEMKLRFFRQSNPQKRWHGNDLNDLTALAITVPYCDVVVTERSWSSMLNTAKVPQRYSTLVTARLQDVVDLLEAPTTATA